MTEDRFISLFSKLKNEFIKQSNLKEEQLEVLKIFENWLQTQNGGGQEKNTLTSGAYIDIIKNWKIFIEEICRRVERHLLKRGIVIKCLSSAYWGRANSSTLCLVLPNRQDIFYRICRTQPRKGPYAGKKIIKAELVLDGHKKSLFLPLLHYQAEMERRIGFSLERESARVEESGKYRFKICFHLNEKYVSIYDCEEIARFLTKFIYITNEYIEKISTTRTG